MILGLILVLCLGAGLYKLFSFGLWLITRGVEFCGEFVIVFLKKFEL